MNLFGRKDKARKGRRETRFAGTWYENDPKKLKEELRSYIDEADKIIDEKQLGEKGVFAVIAPHAGYLFSGSTAAVSYALAAKAKPKAERVILMGPSHYVAFQGVALTSDSTFATPLGDLPLDRKMIDNLSQYPLFEESREVHQREHSLELQLSFIREALGELPIVPLIVGQLPAADEVRMVGQVIRRYVREGDLIVVSSDFTHYGPRYDYVPFTSDVAAERVSALDHEAFACMKEPDLDAFIDFHDRTKCTICGYYPTSVLLSMLPTGSQGQLLQYRTSRDTTMEDTENSVSYLAIAFTPTTGAGSWSSDTEVSKEKLLSETEKQDLLKVARLALEKFVREHKVLKPEEAGVEITDAMKRPLGVFVTLFKKAKKNNKAKAQGSHGDRDLRGCIGYIWPMKPLIEAVIDNAIASSSKDPRFIEVKPSELEALEIEVSVLTPLSRVDSEKEIEIGRHGIVMYINGRQSVFLPHVATEYGWTLEETLNQLANKAGLEPEAWRTGAQYDVFESVMFEEN